MTKEQALLIRHIFDDRETRDRIKTTVSSHVFKEFGVGADADEIIESLTEHQEAIDQLFTFIACHGLDYVAK